MRMGRCALGVVLVLAAACSPSVTAQSDAPPVAVDTPAGPDPNDGARSGTRLKLTWFELADGTRQWDGFYDALRKETCYLYSNWIDGKAYCAPDHTGSIEYSDAGCNTKVIEIYKNPSCVTQPAPYTLDYSYTSCTSQPAHLYTRGAKISLAQYYFMGSDNVCYGPYTTTPASYDYYATGPEVAKTDLVEVTLGSPVGPGRLAMRYYQSPDGMQFQGTVHDAMLGTSCYPVDVQRDGRICSPSANYVSYEDNATCTSPKLTVSNTCTAPKYAVYYPNNACPATPPHYYALGASTAGAPLYYYNGSTCTSQTPPTNTTFYKMGTEVPARTCDSRCRDERSADPAHPLHEFRGAELSRLGAVRRAEGRALLPDEATRRHDPLRRVRRLHADALHRCDVHRGHRPRRTDDGRQRMWHPRETDLRAQVHHAAAGQLLVDGPGLQRR